MVVSRADVVGCMLARFGSPRYLEIGVAAGETFLEVDATHKVAVDPCFNLRVEDHSSENVAFHEVTSDSYFSDIHQPGDWFDVVYIDGLHTLEQTFRDFTNALNVLAVGGVIVIDDVLPTSYAAALPDQADANLVKSFTSDADNSWMGDPYKLIYLIHAFYPSLQLRTVSDNHGQAVVWRAGRARDIFKRYTLDELSRMSFIEMLKDRGPFHFGTLQAIVEEISQTVVDLQR